MARRKSNIAVAEPQQEEPAAQASDTITATQLAEVLGTDPKSCRRFLRKLAGPNRPGKGGRWAIAVSDVEALKERFAAKQVAEADEDVEGEDEVLEDEVDELEDL